MRKTDEKTDKLINFIAKKVIENELDNKSMGRKNKRKRE